MPVRVPTKPAPIQIEFPPIQGPPSGVATDGGIAAYGFETTGIEIVPASCRTHKQISDTMRLWWSANSVVATVALGSLVSFAGIEFWATTAIIVAFNLL